jgi:hypothetical protein
VKRKNTHSRQNSLFFFSFLYRKFSTTHKLREYYETSSTHCLFQQWTVFCQSRPNTHYHF